MKTYVVLPDIHHPYQDKGSINAVFQFLGEYGKQLSGIVLLGDQMDMDAISHWEENNVREQENKRLKTSYQMFDADILTPIEGYVGAKCKERIFFIGNHEDWIEQAIDKLPREMEGLAEIEPNLQLEERGWKVIPFNHTYMLGKLTLCHGLYTNQYHARKMIDTFGESVLYGHTHDIQEYTKTTPVDVNDVHKAKSIGCLCNKNPMYGKNRPNKWAHAFSIVYVFPGGWFNEYTVNIVNGKFAWAGNVYG
jgi:predicted phosphodiesterase